MGKIISIYNFQRSYQYQYQKIDIYLTFIIDKAEKKIQIDFEGLKGGEWPKNTLQ